MKTTKCVQYKGETYYCFANMEDIVEEILKMGFSSVAEFQARTSTSAEFLIGKFWMLVNNTVIVFDVELNCCIIQ